MDRKPKPIARITDKQLSRMITCLEAEPDIARNNVRGPQNGFWRKVASDLNDIGPSRKDVTGWKRAWFDYKFSIKKRVMQHNENITAGLYPKHLSPIHKRVIKLLGLELKKVKLTEDVGSGSEDRNSEEANQYEAEDQTGSNLDGGLMQDDGPASDNDTHDLPSRSTRTIRACQKRLAKLPNITIKMHRTDMDPLANGASSSNAPSYSPSARKRTREAMIRKALETNEALITAINASLPLQQELATELRAATKTFQEMNENMKNVCGALRDLTEALKPK